MALPLGTDEKMGEITNFVANLITLVSALLLIALGILFYLGLQNQNSFNKSGQPLITTTAQQSGAQINATLAAYALSLINKDRNQFGLSNLTLSSESSGQQHSQSMLLNGYFSHWDPYGMKPYMRYTLLGGEGSLSENVASWSSTSCSILGCSGNVDPEQALQKMENEMMYNDSACCNNEHRENILDPLHTQVSIGIAYNSSLIYFTEDFIDNYINWSNYGFDPKNKEMYASGTTQSSYKLFQILISYDPLIGSMPSAQLHNTSSYSYGSEIAGVVSSKVYYYPNVTTILADQYSTSGSQFSVAFNMQKTINATGPGEYTVMLLLNGNGNSFVASTYTIFVGENGKPYTPENV